jgi:hypothetical protein
LSGVLEQIIEAVEAQGGTFDDIKSFVSNPVNLRNLGLLVMGKLKLEGLPCQRLVPHLIPDWVKEVVEDVEPTNFDPKKLKFSSFLRDGDNGRTDGQTMRSRAKEMKANLGLSDVPVLLGPDGKGLETIPAELRGKAYIVLSGTLLRNSDGYLYVPCLGWGGDAWVLNFLWLADDWCEGDRLVSCE